MYVWPCKTACTAHRPAVLHAEIVKLHGILEELEPVSERHGLTEAADITDLIKQHNEVQQQITAAKHRAAQLEVVADLEKRQAHFEACLSAGACMLYPPGIPACTAASSTGHDTRVCMSSWLCCSGGTTVEQCCSDDMLPVTMHT